MKGAKSQEAQIDSSNFAPTTRFQSWGQEWPAHLPFPGAVVDNMSVFSVDWIAHIVVYMYPGIKICVCVCVCVWEGVCVFGGGWSSSALTTRFQ